MSTLREAARAYLVVVSEADAIAETWRLHLHPPKPVIDRWHAKADAALDALRAALDAPPEPAERALAEARAHLEAERVEGQKDRFDAHGLVAALRAEVANRDKTIRQMHEDSLAAVKVTAQERDASREEAERLREALQRGQSVRSGPLADHHP